MKKQTAISAPSKNKYPELEKLGAISDTSNQCGRFVDWCVDHKYLSKLQKLRYKGGLEKILAEYFKIDLQKVEEERRQILADLAKRA